MPMKLSEFEGLEVTQSSIEIPDAAGGLRDALQVDPVERTRATSCMSRSSALSPRCGHDPVDKDELTGEQARVHILTGDERDARREGSDVVGDALAAQAERIAGGA
jgi:hypothetical protein